jgi:hypothetical protein
LEGNTRLHQTNAGDVLEKKKDCGKEVILSKDQEVDETAKRSLKELSKCFEQMRTQRLLKWGKMQISVSF